MGSPTLRWRRGHLRIDVPIGLQIKSGIQKISEIIKNPDYTICAVDLGINQHAVMTIQDGEGRVLKTKIISGRMDNHLRKCYLEKKSRLQRKTKSIPKCESFAKDLSAKVRNLNRNIAHTVSKQIIDFAKKNQTKLIVFEYLGNLKPSKGTKSRRMNQKLGHWVKARIFNFTQYKGLHEGIVCSRVNPRNTSSDCPYCGSKDTISRYSGVILARCNSCNIQGVHADILATRNIGNRFRLKFA